MGAGVFLTLDTYPQFSPETINRPINIENELEITGENRYLLSDIYNGKYFENRVEFTFDGIKCEFFIGKNTRHLLENKNGFTIYSLNVGKESINILYQGEPNEEINALLKSVKINTNEWAEYRDIAFRYDLLTYYEKDYLTVANVDIIPYQESEYATLDDKITSNDREYRFSTSAITDGYVGFHSGELMFVTNNPKALEVFYEKNN